MAQNSKIEWTHHTANLWHGCTKVHEGCDHCYAETLSRRWNRDIWGNDKRRLLIESVWKDLEKQQNLAASKGEVHRVFVGSMMDIFEKPMPLINSKGESIPEILSIPVITTQNLRWRLFEFIDRGDYPNLLFLFLTKRPSNINKYIPEGWKVNPPENVMFGTSPVNQETADKLIPQLLQVNGKKFLSVEPMLGPIDLTHLLLAKDKKCWHCNYQLDGEAGRCLCGTYHEPDIDWVICGGESGHGARPMHPDWARSIRDQCKASGVPFFFKQWGEYVPFKRKKFYSEQKPLWCVKASGELSWWAGDSDMTINYSTNFDSTDCPIEKVGKKAAGRLLDGDEYSEFPKLLNQHTNEPGRTKI